LITGDKTRSDIATFAASLICGARSKMDLFAEQSIGGLIKDGY
jgi:hypothetical protein